MFFGGGGRLRRERRSKNVHQLSVTLEDLCNGATRKLALRNNVICDKCEGRGGKKGAVEFSKFTLCAWSARAMGNGPVLKIDVKAAVEGR